MNPTSKNHSQRIDLDTTPPDNSLGLQPTSIHLKDVFADAWKIFIKTALPTLGLLVLISFLTAVFRLIYIPADWYIHNINPEYTAIIEKISNSGTLTPEENSLKTNYQIFTSLTLLGRWSIPFFSILFLTLITTGKIYYIQTNELDGSRSWKLSVFAAFQSKEQTLITILYLIFFPIIITFGTILMILPGVYFFIKGIFIIHAIIIDEHGGRQAIRGGKFYLQGNVKTMLILFFIGVFIPFLIGAIISDPMIGMLGYSDEKYYQFIDPSSRNIWIVLFYYFCMHLLENIWFLPFPALIGSAFFYIREQKLKIYQNDDKFYIKHPSASKIHNIKVDPSKDFYYCPVCKKKLPLSARKCTKCGALIQLEPN
ncbi:MAG: zinc ribbon domain-containing protein [Candidatus Lokiarchaeota archaeon]|nr:zinc ribbon domain-containing protein [Candidatus Harpocratesius repetitus]